LVKPLVRVDVMITDEFVPGAMSTLVGLTLNENNTFAAPDLLATPAGSVNAIAVTPTMAATVDRRRRRAKRTFRVGVLGSGMGAPELDVGGQRRAALPRLPA
jgi:ethanolamine utilization microcompartment shell protein EutS